MTSYPSFVASRFKTFPTLAETLHHATTGMVGEAIELAYAPDRPSMLKELGDFDFYLEALKQHAPVPLTCPGGASWYENGRLLMPDLFLTLIAFSGDVLDLSKKAWIYNKPVEELAFWDYIPIFDKLVLNICAYLGVSRDEVRQMNVEKLLKRYPTGYSDAAAQNRADGEAERHG